MTVQRPWIYFLSLFSPWPYSFLLCSSLLLAHAVLPQRDADRILFGCCLHLCQGSFCDASSNSVEAGLPGAQLTPGCRDSVALAGPFFQNFLIQMCFFAAV